MEGRENKDSKRSNNGKEAPLTIANDSRKVRIKVMEGRGTKDSKLSTRTTTTTK